MKNQRFLYFKPLRTTFGISRHDSGFGMIEYGYCGIDDKCNAINIVKVGSYDVFMWRDMDLHLDLTMNGYFRILDGEYEWSYGGRLKKKET